MRPSVIKAAEDRPLARALARAGAVWYSGSVRSIFWQAVAVGAVGLFLWWLVANTGDNLRRAGIPTGFGFLGYAAGFNIIESPIPYAPSMSYARAFLVGILNGLQVAAIGIVLATVLGVFIGLLRLAPNPLTSRMAATYVEVIRNIPLLLQLFFWYALILKLPPVRNAFTLAPGVYLSNRGLVIPTLSADDAAVWVLLAIAIGAGASWWLARRAARIQAATGHRPKLILPVLTLLVGLPAAAALAADVNVSLDVPRLRGFNFAGGMVLSPEFTALATALTIYSASFIAETVRGGILSIGRGQWDAAASIGLSRGRTLRLVIMPQALRVVIPPMISSYGGIIKGTSLGIAIGYPELVSVAQTIMNQTGQAVEAIAIVMGAFLVVNLVISTFLNWYNARIRMDAR